MDVAPSIPAVEVVRSTQLPPAKDMSHHLNRITKNRKVNALKEMYKYAAMEGMVSMAGGELEYACHLSPSQASEYALLIGAQTPDTDMDLRNPLPRDLSL
jgi:hypothetical protein